MPTMDGMELLKEVKSMNPLVKTILISAFDVEDRLFEECNCVDKMLQKPVSIADLINAVEVLLPNRYDCLTD
jgi:DNA-binding response OmpR family regulator